MPTVEKLEKIVVVGFGWVGQANALALVRMGYKVTYFDVVTPSRHFAGQYNALYDEIRPLSSLFEVDDLNTWYIVCIGDRVSEEGVQDISLIEKALNSLRAAKGRVVLRATVLPDYLARLPFDLYVPEFLHELYAVEECLNPFYFVVGSCKEMSWPSFLKEWKLRACKVFVGTPEDASHIKYLSNLWNALRIAFVNEFGDSVALPCTETERKKIENVMDFFFEKKSYLRYGRTFSGHCLPKDTRAFMTAKAGGGRSVPLLQAIYKSNKLHQEVVDTYKALPQWFSSWDYGAYRRNVYSLALRLWRQFNEFVWVRKTRGLLKPIILFFEKLIPPASLPKLKNKWNNFARQNPYYYVNPNTAGGQKTDEFELQETGAADYERYITKDAILRETLDKIVDPELLEIGVGTGRITEYLARNFKRVSGIDISPAMLEIAKKRLNGMTNIVLLETAGNVIPFSDNQFDLIFSLFTFRYFPSFDLIDDYFKEIRRTLKSGGLAKVQLRAGARLHSWQWFYGVSFTPQEAESLARKNGLEVLKTEEENKKSLWLWLKKV